MNKQEIIKEALNIGLDEIEIYETSSSRLSMSLFESKIDSYTIANDQDYLIKALINHKMVECHLASLDNLDINLVLNNLKENALSIESEDISSLYEGEKEYPEVKYKVNTFKNKTYEEKVEILNKLETLCLNLDSRIKQVMSIDYEEVLNTTSITNSKGLNINKSLDYALVSIQLLASENDDNKSAYKVDFIVDDDFDLESFAKKAVLEAVSKLNSKSINSGEYQVIMKNEAMRSLLGALCGLFVGENVYKGISLLKDKLNQKIFDEKINIVDNSLLDYSFNSSPFDDEGVSAKKTVLVEDGILKAYLHNLKSAHMMNMTPTGNGYGASTSPTNLAILNGDKSFDELLKIMNDGIIIEDISGLHAGLNSFTTQFSLLASGFEVKDGKIVRPINLITVAGVFLDMMKDIKAIGNDLEYGINGIGSPSILFNKLNISGE